MTHVYFSYSHQDSDFVDLIENDLVEGGDKVWRDTSSVLEGEAGSEVINAALQ